MKNMKRIFALALALIMVLSLSLSVFAEDPTYSVTITNATGHSYKIYQIFTGDLSQKQVAGATTPETTDDKYEDVLSNIKFGANYTPAKGTTPEAYYAVGDEVPQTVLDTLFDANFKATDITPTGVGQDMTTTGDNATIDGLVAGYYMIVDVTNPLPTDETSSAIICQVVGPVTVASKHSGTTIVKKVQDINDSTGKYTLDEDAAEGEETWIDSADYDIGDTVPFKSTATFTDLSADLTSYKVEFTDIMAPGLNYDTGSMVVTVNGAVHTAAFTITPSAYNNADDTEYNGGTKITVSCDNILPLLGANKASATIVLEYTATLDDEDGGVKFGAPGNPNKIRVKAMPNGEGDYETPWDVNIVFTYKLEANKYANTFDKENPNDNKLPGAGFTLFKWVITTEGENGATSATAGWVQIGNEVKGEEMTKFAWKGLDDGKYKLEETTTPTGYNTIDPIEFEVKAEHVIVADNPTLTNLTGEAKTGEIKFTATTNDGLVSTNVVNKSGMVLPETGGMGTKLFYVVGGVLVAATVVLLVTKKRMSSMA